jgi:hypothetical protein
MIEEWCEDRWMDEAKSTKWERGSEGSWGGGAFYVKTCSEVPENRTGHIQMQCGSNRNECGHLRAIEWKGALKESAEKVQGLHMKPLALELWASRYLCYRGISL